ncbi:MAG TPA: hypothetical protein VJ806_14500 [Luteimonas sp.]|nr:hypothetical protein [Luteimonas sp.]
MPRVSPWISIGALVCAGLLVYWAGLHGGFIFDDVANLIEDPDWKLTSLSYDQLRRAALNGFAGVGGRPLALLSFGLNHYFAGVDPFALKATNLVMHLVNACLVLNLCSRLFVLAPARPESERMGAFAAWIVATAWLVHPLQASTVLYTVQRMEVGAATGILLALLAYLNARLAMIAGRNPWRWFVASGLAMLLGLGFKESAVLAPGYALLIELFVLRFRESQARICKPLVATYAAGVFAAAAAFLFWLLPHYAAPDAYAARDFDLGERLLTQIPVLALYLAQIVFPSPDKLVFYYDNFPISTGLFAPPETAWSLMLLALLVSSAVLLRKRWPLYAFGIAWFFVGHGLTSNIVPLELAFEHRNYLALLGIAIAAAQVASWGGGKLHMDARRTLASLPVVALAALCFIQASTWGEPLRLATALASRNPDSPRASFDLGRLLLERSGGDPSSPQWQFARKEFEHAAALPRSSPLPEQALIIMDSRSGRKTPASVWRSFRAKFSARVITPEGENALFAVLACRQKGICRLSERELYETFAVALKRNPRSAVLHSMYASFAFNIIRDHGLGIAVMRTAVHLAPADAQFKANLAQFLAASGGSSAELDRLLAQVRAANRNGRYDEDLKIIENLRLRPSPRLAPAE